MLTEERLQRIVAIVERAGSATVQELTEELHTSESTIRRDITLLDEDGRINKVRGGAVSKGSRYSTEDAPVTQRMKSNRDEKEKIARYAATLIEPNDFVYIDAGTTTELLIDYITVKNVTFVTNAISHAKKLSIAGYRVHVIGGEYKASTEAIVGEEAIENVERYNFTKGFWGTNGVNPVNGFTTPDASEAALKKKSMENCKERYVLCDSSKFLEISCVTFAKFESARIITTRVDQDKYGRFTNIYTVE